MIFYALFALKNKIITKMKFVGVEASFLKFYSAKLQKMQILGN